MAKKPSITEIFNKMSYNDRKAENIDDKMVKEYYLDLKNSTEIKSLNTAIHTAARIGSKSNVSPWKATLHERALVLLDIGKKLSEEANRLSELQDFREKDYSLLIDFFNYYSSICHKLDIKWIPYECKYVLVVLSGDVPFFILGSIISAAFGAGCPVVVLYSIKNPWFLLFLKEVFSRTTLPDHFFNLVPNNDNNKRDLEDISHQKIVFLGNDLSVGNLYEKISFTTFRFVNLNKTATIIFESCDLSSAIDKIFSETWDKKFATMWGVSTVVVQESVYQKFLDMLESRIEQLTDEQERALIKNCIIPVEERAQIILQDQNREMEASAPVLKVLSCRTANEGVNFLNSYQYYLGTSIWSENSSQALEVASKLISKNVWINCHGIIEPSVSFQSSDNNGYVVFGGYEGILEYVNIPIEYLGSTTTFLQINPGKSQVEETVLSAQKAFKKWLLVENKGIYLMKIAESLKNHTELSNLSEVVIDVLSMKNTNTLSRSCNSNFYTIHEKFPIGVIAILIEDFDLTRLMYLITTAIAFGNAVVVSLRTTKPTTLIGPLVDVFNAHLPRGLLNVFIEEHFTAVVLLASNPIIQAIWLYPECLFSPPYVDFIKKCSSKTRTRIWFIRNLLDNFHSLAFMYQRECLSNKIIWLTKVDHFP